MKKKILNVLVILAIIVVPFGIIVAQAKSLNGYLTQVSKVKLLDINEDGWIVDSAKIRYINGGNVLLDMNYGILYKEDDPEVSTMPKIGLALKRHHDHFIYDMNGNMVKQKLLDANVSDYYTKDISNRLFYYNDEFYTITDAKSATADYGLNTVDVSLEDEAEEQNDNKKYSLVKYDMDFKNAGHIDIIDESDVSDVVYTNVRVNNVDNELYVIATTDDIVYADLSSSDNKKCIINKVNDGFTTATSIDCNLENVKKYFPDYAFQLENALGDNQFDYKSDKNIIISENGDKLIYSKNNNEVIEIAAEVGKFTNVRFFNDMIVAIEDTVENKNINFFYSRINLYDNNGKMIDQIVDLNAYKDIDIDEANNKFIVSIISLDRVLGDVAISYWNDDYDPSIVQLGYEEYAFEEEQPNPNTSDIIIIGFILVFGVSLYLYKKCKKAL